MNEKSVVKLSSFVQTMTQVAKNATLFRFNVHVFNVPHYTRLVNVSLCCLGYTNTILGVYCTSAVLVLNIFHNTAG